MSNKYTEAAVKAKLETSDVWVARSFLVLMEDDAVLSADKNLFASLKEYYVNFQTLTDKHVSLLRRKLTGTPTYLSHLVRKANGS
jgi:hypothetical protein